MKLTIKAISENESFARMCVAGFCTQLNPSIDVITDIKTAVSEAVTNAIVHAYPNNDNNAYVDISAQISGTMLTVSVSDSGIGILDIGEARMPFYTSKPGSERSGIGFTVMEGFMDTVEVLSSPGKGTTVIMTKNIVGEAAQVGC